MAELDLDWSFPCMLIRLYSSKFIFIKHKKYEKKSICSNIVSFSDCGILHIYKSHTFLLSWDYSIPFSPFSFYRKHLASSTIVMACYVNISVKDSNVPLVIVNVFWQEDTL